MAETTRVLNMAPTGRYADGSPMYEFHCPFPTRGVVVLPKGFDTPEEAQADAEADVREYQSRAWPGGMGAPLGVTKRGGKLHGVVCRYHSGS